jgi:site-specific recombinase XerD
MSARARAAAGVAQARPYDLRHSFASLLLHEGRDVIERAPAHVGALEQPAPGA